MKATDRMTDDMLYPLALLADDDGTKETATLWISGIYVHFVAVMAQVHLLLDYEWN